MTVHATACMVRWNTWPDNAACKRFSTFKSLQTLASRCSRNIVQRRSLLHVTDFWNLASLQAVQCNGSIKLRDFYYDSWANNGPKLIRSMESVHLKSVLILFWVESSGYSSNWGASGTFVTDWSGGGPEEVREATSRCNLVLQKSKGFPR